jgi:large subunit ribosomal protein L32
MAVPKKKTSKSKRNLRRAHDAIKKPAMATCSNCGEPKLPHNVCKACGYYNGKQILEVEEA